MLVYSESSSADIRNFYGFEFAKHSLTTPPPSTNLRGSELLLLKRKPTDRRSNGMVHFSCVFVFAASVFFSIFSSRRKDFLSFIFLFCRAKQAFHTIWNNVLIAYYNPFVNSEELSLFTSLAQSSPATENWNLIKRFRNFNFKCAPCTSNNLGQIQGGCSCLWSGFSCFTDSLALPMRWMAGGRCTNVMHAIKVFIVASHHLCFACLTSTSKQKLLSPVVIFIESETFSLQWNKLGDHERYTTSRLTRIKSCCAY